MSKAKRFTAPPTDVGHNRAPISERQLDIFDFGELVVVDEVAARPIEVLGDAA